MFFSRSTNQCYFSYDFSVTVRVKSYHFSDFSVIVQLQLVFFQLLFQLIDF